MVDIKFMRYYEYAPPPQYLKNDLIIKVLVWKKEKERLLPIDWIKNERVDEWS